MKKLITTLVLSICLLPVITWTGNALTSTTASDVTANSITTVAGATVGTTLTVGTANTDEFMFIPPSIAVSTGTDKYVFECVTTPTSSNSYATDLNYLQANAGTSTVCIPISLIGRDATSKGVAIKSIDVQYEVVTASAGVTYPRFTLYKVDIATNSAYRQTFSTYTAITTTYDVNHDGDNERPTTGIHNLTLTVTTPVYYTSRQGYLLVATTVPTYPAGTIAECVFRFKGALVNLNEAKY